MILERRAYHVRYLTAILLLDVTSGPMGEMKLAKQTRSRVLPVDTQRPLVLPPALRPTSLGRLSINDKRDIALYIGMLLWGVILNVFYPFDYDDVVVFRRTCLLYIGVAIYFVGNRSMHYAADRWGLGLMYSALVGLMVGQGIEMCLYVWLRNLLFEDSLHSSRWLHVALRLDLQYVLQVHARGAGTKP